MHNQGKAIAHKLQGIEDDVHFLRQDLLKYFPHEDTTLNESLLILVYKIKDAVEALTELADEQEEITNQYEVALAALDNERYRGM